jgi:hypothetical protein
MSEPKEFDWGRPAGGGTPDEVAERIKRVYPTLRERLLKKALLIALRRSQLRTPVRTGTLRRSETTRIEEQGARGYVGTNVMYAPFVHARVRFFEQGIEDSRGEIAAMMEAGGKAWAQAVVEGTKEFDWGHAA